LVDDAYSSIRGYNYTTFKSGGAHLINGQWYDSAFQATQMIWKSTTSMGIGVGAFSYVASGAYLLIRVWYFPTGNVPNQYATNVLPAP
jgi:hypothetical protein